MFRQFRNQKIITLKALVHNKNSHIDLLTAYIALVEQRNKTLEKTLREIEVRYVN